MTYSVGGLIQAVDYNTFAQGGASPDNNVANLNTIWATGTLDKGWGQSSPVSTVASAATVTATQWSTLFSRFTTIASQTNTSVTAIANPIAGELIAVKSNFSSNLSSCFTNRNNAAAVGATITSGGAATFSTAWSDSLTAVHTITFANANSARYFFNAGGRITWAGARSGGSSSSSNTAWTNLLTSCGTLNITTGTSTQVIAGTSYTGTTKTGGSGSPVTLLTGTGFYDLTTSDQEVFKQLDSTYLYTTNFVSVNIKANAAAGSATVITITVLYNDAHSTYEPGTVVDGTLTSTVTLVQPSTTFLTNTWGTPTLSSSIASNTYAASYLIAGGGAGGGYNYGGGGGAGVVLASTLQFVPGTTYTVTIGSGGTAATSGGSGTNGSDSSITTAQLLTAAGGGSGGSGGGTAGAQATGNNGGNGGGAGGAASESVGGSGIAGQGFNGGDSTTTNRAGGGGGGSSANGASTSDTTGGAGGAGTTSSITGSSDTYGGGGGGGGTAGGAGGSGGGGAGSSGAGTAGTANTGGGGGGGGNAAAGGAGGSGVVFISVPTANYTGTTTGSPTVTTSGSNTIMRFNSSGSYTA
jgi:hypothetical protein